MKYHLIPEDELKILIKAAKNCGEDTRSLEEIQSYQARELDAKKINFVKLEDIIREIICDKFELIGFNHVDNSINTEFEFELKEELYNKIKQAFEEGRLWKD